MERLDKIDTVEKKVVRRKPFTKRKKKVPAVKKNMPRPFAPQAKKINKHIAQFTMRGYQQYFTVDDLKRVYDRNSGFCCFCGLELTSTPRRVNSCSFRFKLPLEAKGAMDLENLIIVCPTCKNKRVPKRPTEYPIYDYNAFSDITVQLIQSVIEGDIEKISYFKSKLDNSLSDYIGMLFYKPLGTPKAIGISDIGKKAKMSDVLVSMTEELQRILKETTYEKEYRPIRVADTSEL